MITNPYKEMNRTRKVFNLVDGPGETLVSSCLIGHPHHPCSLGMKQLLHIQYLPERRNKEVSTQVTGVVNTHDSSVRVSAIQDSYRPLC